MPVRFSRLRKIRIVRKSASSFLIGTKLLLIRSGFHRHPPEKTQSTRGHLFFMHNGFDMLALARDRMQSFFLSPCVYLARIVLDKTALPGCKASHWNFRRERAGGNQARIWQEWKSADRGRRLSNVFFLPATGFPSSAMVVNTGVFDPRCVVNLEEEFIITGRSFFTDPERGLLR